MEDLQTIDKRLEKIERLLSTAKDVFNIDELAEFTGLSKSHIYKLTHKLRIPFYKQAKHLYFDRAEIVEWLKENRFAPSDEIEKQASTYVTLKKGGIK